MSRACAGFSDDFWTGHAVPPGESASLNGRRVLRHTAHAISWSPLGAAAVLALAVGATVALSGSPASSVLPLAAATLAAGALAGLHDPASALLGAVPASAARRRLHRLALVVPASALAWAGLLTAARLDDGWSAGWPAAPLAALLAAGVAVATWAPQGRAVAAAVALPMAWAVLHQLLGQSHGVAGTSLGDWAVSAWLVHPWAVAAVAGVAAAAGWRR